MEETGLGISSGDSDRYCRIIPGTMMPVPWQSGLGQVMISMEEKDGSPFFGNPREVLNLFLQKAKPHGFQWKAAFELEFFVIESGRTAGEKPKLPAFLSGETSEGQLYSISSLELCRNWLHLTTTLELISTCILRWWSNLLHRWLLVLVLWVIATCLLSLFYWYKGSSECLWFS